MTKMKIIPPLTDLGNGLALSALQNIDESQFTVYATLDIQRPTTLNNFRIFAHELQRAHQQGEAKALADAAKIKADNVAFIGAGKPRIERTKDKLILCFVDESRPTKLQRHYFGLGTPQQVEYVMQTQPVEPIKASPKFLDTALNCGARLSGDPDGSNAVEVVFTPAAWQQFDRLVSEKNIAADTWFEKTAWVQEQIGTFPSASLGRHHADVMRDEIQRLRAKVAHLERFADNHPDTQLLDFLTSRASINFDDENCLLRFEVPSAFEGANNLREIIAAAKGEADRDDAEANGEANG